MPECHFMEMVEEPIETEQVEPDAEFPGEPYVAFESIRTHFHCERENPAIQYLPVSGGDGTPASAGQVVTQRDGLGRPEDIERRPRIQVGARFDYPPPNTMDLKRDNRIPVPELRVELVRELQRCHRL